MGDGDEGAAILARQPQKQLDDPGAGGGVEVSGRLVGEQDPRIIDKGAGDRHALLFPAAELGGKVIQASGEPHAVEQAPCFLCAPRAAEHGREHHVLQRGQFGKQEVGLEDEAHAAVAEGCKPVATEGEELLPLEGDGPCARMFQSGQDVEQGRFSRARGTAQEDHLAAGHIEIDPFQHLETLRAELIRLPETAR